MTWKLRCGGWNRCVLHHFAANQESSSPPPFFAENAKEGWGTRCLELVNNAFNESIAILPANL